MGKIRVWTAATVAMGLLAGCGGGGGGGTAPQFPPIPTDGPGQVSWGDDLVAVIGDYNANLPIPTSGSANYEGVAIIPLQGAAVPESTALAGRVDFSANYGTNRLSGAITDLSRVSAPSNAPATGGSRVDGELTFTTNVIRDRQDVDQPFAATMPISGTLTDTAGGLASGGYAGQLGIVFTRGNVGGAYPAYFEGVISEGVITNGSADGFSGSIAGLLER